MNKCKIELQYWRSKSTTLLALPSTCASCAAPLLPSQSAESAEAEIKALANQGIFLTEDLTTSSEVVSAMVTTDDSISSSLDVQKEPPALNDLIEHEQQQAGTSSLEDQIADSNPPSPITRGQGGGGQTCKSGPPSPVSAVGRKRRSRDDLTERNDLAGDLGDLESKRKNSLRGSGGSGNAVGVKNTRFKRPKTASVN